jgi:inner membrane protein
VHAHRLGDSLTCYPVARTTMEPITHFLTGACIGRAGFNRKTACATVVAVLAAEAADLDILWGFAGPVEELKHHRGITHTFLGAPFVALATVAVVGGIYAWRHRSRPSPASSANTANSAVLPTLRWGWLYLTALVAALSHILLDWTNNYGVRPFFPFNPRWYAGSFMFIAEPVLWGVFIIALVLPALFALTDREIGARRTLFRGRNWAIFALAATFILGCWRWAEQAHARAMFDNIQITTAPILRMTIEPYPINPWRWHAILETPGFYQTAEVNTRTGAIDSDAQNDILYKPEDTRAVEAAKRTFLGRVYLDWGRWAVVRDMGQIPAPGISPPDLPPQRTWTTVEFSDLRFAYALRPGGSSSPPAGLSGWVYIIDNREDGGECMAGREQK